MVLFTGVGKRIAVEVKPQNAGTADLVRGIFQCVKYAAVLEAEERARQTDCDCVAILALGGAFPVELSGLKAALAVEVWDRLGKEVPNKRIKADSDSSSR